MKSISPERERIAKVFKTHIEKAIEELGIGYQVDLQGKFDSTPIPNPYRSYSKRWNPLSKYFILSFVFMLTLFSYGSS